MPYCRDCGSSVGTDDEFCCECGAPQSEGAEDRVAGPETLTWVCQDCGETTPKNDTPCRECGSHQYVKINADVGGSVGDADRPADRNPQTDTFYTLTLGLSGLWLLFILLWLGTGAALYSLLGLGCIVISLLTMVVDLSKVEGKLYDTSAPVWLLAAVVLWVVIMPIYLYKRSQL